jgi:glutathione S-transferase
MFDLYTALTPNGLKPAIALECLDLEYRIKPVNLSSGEQKSPDFLALNPNGRIPVLVDYSVPGSPIALSESAAILIYLAEKTGRLLPVEPEPRARVFEQLFLHASGIAPAFGNAGWFMRSAPEPLTIAIDRFRNEALRIMGLIDSVLVGQPFVAGASLSIADIAHFGWLSRPDYIEIDLSSFPNLALWQSRLAGEPAFKNAAARLKAATSF